MGGMTNSGGETKPFHVEGSEVLKDRLLGTLEALRGGSYPKAHFSQALNGLLGEHFIQHLLRDAPATGNFWIDESGNRTRCTIWIERTLKRRFHFVPGATSAWSWYGRSVIGDPMSTPDHIVTVKLADNTMRLAALEQKFRFTLADANATPAKYMKHLLVGLSNLPSRKDNTDVDGYCAALVEALKRYVKPIRAEGDDAGSADDVFPGSVPQLAFLSMALEHGSIQFSEERSRESGASRLTVDTLGFLTPLVGKTPFVDDLNRKVVARARVHLWVGLDELLRCYSAKQVEDAANKALGEYWNALVNPDWRERRKSER